jgi:hypothetical protein
MRFVGGDDGRVFLIDGGVTELGTFEWGSGGARCAELAKVILRHVLPGESSSQHEARAIALHRRFMYRSIATWTKGVAWTRSDNEFTSIIAEIDQVEKETAQLRASRESPRYPAIMPGGTEVWDEAPDITAQERRRAQREDER